MSSAAGATLTRRVTRNQTSAKRNSGSPAKKQSFDSPQHKIGERQKKNENAKKTQKQGLLSHSKDNELPG